MAASGLEARKGALALLAGVLGNRWMISDLVENKGSPLARLVPADRARAQRLAIVTLKHIGPADRLLRPYLKKVPPLQVMNVLRLAIVELAVTGAAAHGVVNDAVQIVRANRKTTRMAGLVNAVLRAAAQDIETRWGDLPPNGLPKWLREPVEAKWGRAVVHEIELAHARSAPLDLTLSPMADASDLRQLGGTMLPTGTLRLPNAGQVSALAGYEKGVWWVQDAAAAIPAKVLGAQKGERVLDLCAAPGGKTLQLAATGAEVHALDVSQARMSRLLENLRRAGQKVRTIVADAIEWEPGSPYDAILLDAPCSASGTIRRHPDLPFVRDGSQVETLTRLQARLIDKAISWLKPGGRLVFATCSLLPVEGELQARAALKRHDNLKQIPESYKLPGIEAEWVGEFGLRMRPDYWPTTGGMDGFFVTAFQRD